MPLGVLLAGAYTAARSLGVRRVGAALTRLHRGPGLQRLVNNDILFSTRDPAEAARVLTTAPINYVFLDRQTTDTLGFPTDGLLEERFNNPHVVVYAVATAVQAKRVEGVR